MLSVIADSGRVSLYILDKSDMGYLPDTVLKKVFEKIVLLKEPDRPFHVSKIEEIREGKLQWDQYKAECLENLFKEKYAEKYGEKVR